MGLLIWLVKQGPPRKKRAMRYANPGLVAYYWDGGAPKKHVVKDISSTGVYVYTKELWCVGTIVALTLQDAGDREGKAAVPPIVLPCRVVRHGEDGIGFNFMFQGNEARKALKRFMRSAGFQESRASGSDRGQALLEFVAVIPMLFLLIALAFNFATWLYGWVAVGNAVRAAGDYAMIGGAYAGLPLTATPSTLQSLVTADLAHLPNRSSSNPQACVRTNDNGTITTLLDMPSGACANYSNPTADTEPVAAGSTITYPNLAVDVTYTYTSFFTGSTFLGLPLTVLPSSIHRRTLMRMVQ
jgi:Flp pilus assembly protein TadG